MSCKCENCQCENCQCEEKLFEVSSGLHNKWGMKAGYFILFYLLIMGLVILIGFLLYKYFYGEIEYVDRYEVAKINQELYNLGIPNPEHKYSEVDAKWKENYNTLILNINKNCANGNFTLSRESNKIMDTYGLNKPKNKFYKDLIIKEGCLGEYGRTIGKDTDKMFSSQYSPFNIKIDDIEKSRQFNLKNIGK